MAETKEPRSVEMEFKKSFNQTDESCEELANTSSSKLGKITKSHQYLAAAIVCMSAASAGIGLSWTSKDLRHTEFGYLYMQPLSKLRWITFLFAIGAIVAAVPLGILADKIGRKKVTILISISYIISYLLATYTRNIEILYLARFFTGVAVGGSYVVCPIYISEFAEKSIRSLLSMSFQLFLSLGILFGFVFGAFDLYWRLLSLVCIVFPILNLIGLYYLPETPIWLLKNRRETEAATAIKWYWGRSCNVNNAIQAIKSELDTTASGSCGIRDLFAIKANRKGFIKCVMLMFFQQFSGISAVIFFAELIFESAYTTMSASFCAIIIGIVQVLMTFVSAGLIDRVGRKILLIFSSSAMCLCLTAFGLYTHTIYSRDYNYNQSNFSMLPLIILIGFIAGYSLGYGPVPWVMLDEMLSPDIKTIATSLTVMFKWILMLFVTVVSIIFGFEFTLFWIFAVFMAIGTVYGITCLFETKGKTYAEIKMKLLGETYFDRS